MLQNADGSLENPNCISLTALSHSGYSEERSNSDLHDTPISSRSHIGADGDPALTGIGHECVSKMDSTGTMSSRLFSNHASGTNSTVSEAESAEVTEVSSVVIIDQHTYEPLHAFRLNPHERGYSIISTSLEEDSSFYIVGW